MNEQLFVKKGSLGKFKVPKLYSLSKAFDSKSMENDERFCDVFTEVKVVPVEEKNEKLGFPINMCIFTKNPDLRLQLLGTVQFALDRPKAFDPMWFKILESIKDARLTKPVEIILNAGHDCSAVKIISVEGTVFVEEGENKHFFFLPQKLERDFEKLSREEICEIFVAELNSFLEKAKEKTSIPASMGYDIHKSVYYSTYFPEADIQVVKAEDYCSTHKVLLDSEGKCPKCIKDFESIREHAEHH